MLCNNSNGSEPSVPTPATSRCEPPSRAGWASSRGRRRWPRDAEHGADGQRDRAAFGADGHVPFDFAGLPGQQPGHVDHGGGYAAEAR